MRVARCDCLKTKMRKSQEVGSCDCITIRAFFTAKMRRGMKEGIETGKEDEKKEIKEQET